MEAHATAEVLQLAGTDVRGHNQYRILEVDLPTQTVRQSALVQNLEQKVEDIRVRLLDFVEQDDGVGLPADFFRQLATLFVAHVSRRGTDKAGDGELLKIFAHVDTNQGISRIEQIFRQLLGQVRLADAGRTEEHEGADGLVRVFQSDAVALDGLDHLLDRFVLTDHLLLQFASHLQEADILGLGDTLDRDAGHHGDDLGDLLFGYRLAVGFHLLVPLLGSGVQFLFILAFLVAVAGCQFEVLRFDGCQLVAVGILHLGLQLLDDLRSNDIGNVDAGASLVQRIDSLVGEVAVADVTLCQFDTGLQRFGRIGNIMMLLVASFDVFEDLQRFLRRRRIHDNLLEATLQGTVLLDILSIFVERRRADALDFSASQSRLQHIRRIHRAGSRTGTHDGMNLVNEENNVRVLRQLVQDGLDTFFKLSPILRPGHD